ncbi:MAG TPA: TIGR01458 family HAD-type hydrolase [Solirubrobacteraceae bacterium]|nr:TIGR01458 family HAD-type hydrolase [Solirubrobacteraceae bacterium]
MSAHEQMFGVLLDIDGVLYVGDEPIAGAQEALEELRQMPGGVRLVTNTTSRSRAAVVEHLRELGFEAAVEDVLTPAAMAVRHCRERGHESVELVVSDGLREDLTELEGAAAGAHVDAVILGDVGEHFDAELLNRIFRLLMDGAELVALQHNRYWRRADGLTLDVGAYASALEYATHRDAVVVGKPSEEFFRTAMADLGVEQAVMIGDDVEADVGGAMAAGLPGVLVRTGKYLQKALPQEVTPTAIVDSIVDVPGLLARVLPAA